METIKYQNCCEKAKKIIDEVTLLFNNCKAEQDIEKKKQLYKQFVDKQTTLYACYDILIKFQ